MGTPAEITRHSMDATYQLESYLETLKKLYGDAVSSGAMTTDKSDEALAELQFSFVCFLVGQPTTPSKSGSKCSKYSVRAIGRFQNAQTFTWPSFKTCTFRSGKYPTTFSST